MYALTASERVEDVKLILGNKKHQELKRLSDSLANLLYVLEKAHVTDEEYEQFVEDIEAVSTVLANEQKIMRIFQTITLMLFDS